MAYDSIVYTLGLIGMTPRTGLTNQAIRQLRTRHGSFDDPNALMAFDRDVEGEQRWHTTGLVDGVLMLLIVSTEREIKREAVIRSIFSERQPLGKGKSMRASSVERSKVTKRPIALNEDINTTDIPELPPGAWKNAVRGKYYRPVKKAVSVRVDIDILAWLKSQGEVGYLTRINSVLRKAMLADLRKQKAS